MSIRKGKPVERGYFKDLGLKYLIDSAKVYTKLSNKELAKTFGISVNTMKKIQNQNTRNLANFKPSTFKKISGAFPKIDKPTQLTLAEISKGLKQVNGKISKVRLNELIKKSEKYTEKKIKEYGRKLKGLYTTDRDAYLFYKALYEGQKRK